jgi:muramidase (phage lysozyme)
MDPQLQDLIIQMQELIRTLKSTSGTSASGSTVKGTGPASDKTVNSLINALGKLAVKLDGTKRTRAEEEKAMKRFTADVNRASTAQEKQAEAIKKEIEKRKEAALRSKMTAEEIAKREKDLADEKKKIFDDEKKAAKQRELDKKTEAVRGVAQAKSSSQQLFDTYSTLGSGTDLLKTRFFDLAGSSMGGQVALRALAAGAEGAVKSLSAYSTALYNGERGAEVSAKALTELASPVLKLMDTIGLIVQIGSFFVPGGLLAKGLTAAIGGLISLGSKAGEAALKFNELAAKQSDKLFKSFNELSQAGISTAQGMDGVLPLMQTLGMTVAEMDEFNKLITSNSSKLSLLGATAEGGAQAFSKVAGGLVKSDLGRQLELLGITTKDQRESALAYMNIQARTGQLELKSTRQLIDESGKFAKELDLSARLTGQTRKEQEQAREANLAESRYRAALYSARQRGDEDEIARLEKAGTMAAMLRGIGLETQATGTLQFAAGRGAMTTPESIQAAMQLGLANVLNDPSISAVQALQQGLGNAKGQLDYLADTNAYIGEVAAIQGDIPKTLDAIQRLENIQKAAIAAGFTGPEGVAKFMQTEQGRRMLPSKTTQQMVDAGRRQQSAAMMMDSVVDSFNGAATINELAATKFQEAVDLFASTVGAKAPTGGTYNTAPTTTPTPTAPPLPPGPLPSGSTGTGLDMGGSEIMDAARAGAEARRANLTTEQASIRAMDNAIASTANRTSALLNYIGQIEGRGNYNILQGGSTKQDLTQMSVAQVMEYQRKMPGMGHESSAAGKYQIVRPTLEGLVKQGVVKPEEKFDAATQDKLATALMKNRGLDKYLTGSMTPESFANNLSKEWASLPTQTGQSAYAGVGSNKSLVSRDSFMQMLKSQAGEKFAGSVTKYPSTAPEKFAGSVTKYPSIAPRPMSTIPLPDSSVTPPGASALGSSSTSAIAEDIARQAAMAAQKSGTTSDPQMISLMSELVSLQRASNSTAARMLQLSSA